MQQIPRRVFAVVVLVTLGALTSCDADRLPQSPNALGPGANTSREDPMAGGPRLDRRHDAAAYVAADPF